jgi:hypothetical protein
VAALTISSTSNTAVCQGNGLTTSFNFTFPVPLASELSVYLTNPDSAPVLLGQGQYSVTGIGSAVGGAVTYPLTGSPISSGSTLTIQRIVPYQQLTDIVNQSGYYPNVVENALDYLTMQTQQLAQGEQLTLQVPLEATTRNLLLPGAAERANQLVGFDVNGNAITYNITASVGAGNLTSEGPFVAGTGFTPGVTTSLVLSQAYGIPANVQVHFDGVYQGPDQYSLSGAQITFNAAIPVGVSKVYIVGGTTLSAYIPPANSVGTTQIQNGAVGSAQIAPGAVGAAQLAAGVVMAQVNASALNQVASGHFFTSDGAKIQRIQDRIFVGTASQNDGNASAASTDWTGLGVLGGPAPFAYLENNSALNVAAPFAQNGIFAASRASDSVNPAGGGASIGFSSLLYNDNSTLLGWSTWNYYGTHVRFPYATGQSSIGMELDMSNLGAAKPIYPSNMFTTGAQMTLWLAAGGEMANQNGQSYAFNNVSAAIGIIANNGGNYANCAFDKGIVFHDKALNPNGSAICMAVGHNTQWFNTSNQLVAQIGCKNAVLAGAQQMNFTNSGIQFADTQSGNIQFAISNTVTNAANFLAVTGAATGATPYLSSYGSDTNVDLLLLPKGSGLVAFGSYTAGTVTQAGYITVKDGSGTTRRLLVG